MGEARAGDRGRGKRLLHPEHRHESHERGLGHYWHDRIFHALPDRPPEFDVEYARRMADVVFPAPTESTRIIWAGTSGRTSTGAGRTPTREKRSQWGRPGAQGHEKLFEVRDTEDDASFIANYLTTS